MPAIVGRPTRPGIYLPDGALDGWEAAKNDAATTAAELGFVGDSVTSGQPGNSDGDASDNPQDWLNDSYYGQARDLLAARIPHGLTAEFFGLNESLLRNVNYHDGTAGNTPHAPLVYNDGVLGGHDHQWAVNRNGWWFYATALESPVVPWTNANTWMVKFTPPYDDAIKVEAIYANYFGTNNGTFYYGSSADGSGKLQTAPIPLALLSTGYETHRLAVWEGSASRPTVYLGQQSAVQTLGLLGFVVYRRADGGLRTFRHAFTGNTAAQFGSRTTGVPTDRIKAIVGGFDGTDYGGTGFPTAPHCLVFALGINDCNRTLSEDGGENADPWHYEQVLRATVEAGRRARPDMSIVFLMPYYPPQDYCDTTGFSQNDSWEPYVAAAMRVAQEYGCVVVSMNERVGSTPLAQGFLAATDGHPVTEGYRVMAETLVEVLG